MKKIKAFPATDVIKSRNSNNCLSADQALSFLPTSGSIIVWRLNGFGLNWREVNDERHRCDHGSSKNHSDAVITTINQNRNPKGVARGNIGAKMLLCVYGMGPPLITTYDQGVHFPMT